MNFLLYEIFLFCLRGSEPVFIVFGLISPSFVFFQFWEYILHFYQLLFFSIPFIIKKIFDNTNSKQQI